MSEQSPEQKRRIPPVVIVGIILAVICGISLYIRIALPYDKIFVNDWVLLRETDAYYYIRNIETLVHNSLHYNSFDPYMLYPGGDGGLGRPFFAWLVAAITLLVSRGTPTLHTIEVVGAYMPAILGTLTLIPVYFIGKELFNRWVGILAAILAAILPSEFLHRSLLGFTDHHVAEVLFSTVCILFLIMAIKRAREREISFSHILSREWSTITKPLVYTLLAGIFLGIYLLTWQGGLLFIFIVFAYLVIQFIVDHLTHKSTDYLCIVGTPLFLIAFIMLLPLVSRGSFDALTRVSLLVAILVPIVLSIISRLMAGRALKPVYYPLALLGLAGIGLAALHAINPSLLQSMLSQFSIFVTSGARLTILEAQPITPRIGWANFTMSFFISFISLAMLIYVATKEKSTDKPLFLIWSVIMLIAVLGQRRFGYYYTINAALLTGYFSWKMLDIAGLRRLLAKSKEVVGAVKKFKKREKASEKARKRTFMQPRGVWVRVIVVGIVLFFFVFFPNIPIGKALATSSIIMTEGWYSSLLWLKDNSPEPFDDPDFYYALYPPRDEFEYSETAYGVMSWWDYGYFITQVAHRIPNAHPGGGYRNLVGRFLIAQNESLAQEIVEQHNLRVEYVMIDYAMPIGKFHAMPEWANVSISEFFDAYYIQTENGLQGGVLYHPAYYQSIVVRLYNFDGKAVVPTESLVISYMDKEPEPGVKYKEVTSSKSFSTYEEAQAYVANQTSGNYRIVGTNPFSSPVPLEALTSYELVYQSGATTSTSTVKIFEYLGSGES